VSRVALVSGGARGIGRAAALELGRAGLAVAIGEDAGYITGQTLSVSGGLTMA
jgi:NAD(P)-dependent dehydrogenase (short-subunit alcohol dehydrogenase family)